MKASNGSVFLWAVSQLTQSGLCFWFGSSSWQTRSCKVGGMEVREMGTLSFSIRRLQGTQPALILSEKTFGTFLMIYSFYPLILKGSSFRQNPATNILKLCPGKKEGTEGKSQCPDDSWKVACCEARHSSLTGRREVSQELGRRTSAPTWMYRLLNFGRTTTFYGIMIFVEWTVLELF